MPTHVHILINETFAIPLDQFLKAFKQQTSKALKADQDHFWQKRYYDFNVQTEDKFFEKMKYIHRNPVADGLAEAPELYPWSSFHHYATGTPGPVEIESQWLASRRERSAATEINPIPCPPQPPPNEDFTNLPQTKQRTYEQVQP